jgi:hypothetical protein
MVGQFLESDISGIVNYLFIRGKYNLANGFEFWSHIELTMRKAAGDIRDFLGIARSIMLNPCVLGRRGAVIFGLFNGIM